MANNQLYKPSRVVARALCQTYQMIIHSVRRHGRYRLVAWKHSNFEAAAEEDIFAFKGPVDEAMFQGFWFHSMAWEFTARLSCMSTRHKKHAAWYRNPGPMWDVYLRKRRLLPSKQRLSLPPCLESRWRPMMFCHRRLVMRRKRRHICNRYWRGWQAAKRISIEPLGLIACKQWVTSRSLRFRVVESLCQRSTDGPRGTVSGFIATRCVRWLWSSILNGAD